MIIPTESMLQTAATPSAIVSNEKLTWNPSPTRHGKVLDEVASSMRTAATEMSSCLDFSDVSSSSLIEEEGSLGPLETLKPRPILKTTESTSVRKNVGFDSVSIRSYQQTIGDNPSVSYGPPIQLDWEYEQHDELDIDEYEFKRGISRRTLRQLAITYYQRKAILSRNYGFTEEELKRAKKDANKIKIRRGLTNYFLPMMPVENAIESAGRKAKRLIGKGNQ